MKRVIVCLLCLCCCVSCKEKDSITDDIRIPIVSIETPKEAIPEEMTTVNTSGSLYSPNPTVSNATETDQYAILFDSMLIVPEEICGENKWVDIVQVSMHADKEKENRINELLMEQERWAEKYVGYEEKPSSPTIYCHSSRYLSVMNYWWYLHNPPNSLYYYTTIDMQTGDKVRLDDLVEFNKEFIEYLKFGKFIEPEWPEFDAPSQSMQEWLRTLPDDEILAELNECSKEQIDFYIEDEERYDFYAMYNRCAFYLEDNRLIIVFNKSNESESSLIANVNDIENFLKVPKW